MSKAQEKLQEQQESIAYLRKILRPGTTVYTVIRSVSSSGMSRTMDVYTIHKGQLTYLTGYVAKVTGSSRTKQGAIRSQGGGMDMGFALIYYLSRVLYPKGFKLAKGQYGRNSDTSGRDDDGGYALRQQWI